MRSIALLSLAVCLPLAALPAAEEERDMKIRIGGYALLDGGYIAETQDVTAKDWLSEPYGGIMTGLRLTGNPSDRLQFVLHPELKSSYMVPLRAGSPDGEKAQKAIWEIYLEESKFTWSFGSPDRPSARLNLGYMYHKDNPDGRIFGDYIFRSMIYPSLLFTKFNSPRAQISGLNFEHTPLPGLKYNLFALSETRFYPLYDVSLAATAGYAWGGVLEVGAGANFRGAVPVRPSRTTPKGGEGEGVLDNTYKFVPFQPGTLVSTSKGPQTISITKVDGADSAVVIILDSAGVELSNKRVAAVKDGIAGLGDGLLTNEGLIGLTRNPSGSGELYSELNGTNTSYSFAGQIYTLRAAISPLGFLEKNPLGKDALKIYAEGAVLGWKNYPAYYEKRSERIPIMAGVYLPTFNLLDFLAVEGEYFPSKHIPTYEVRFKKNAPQPGAWKNPTMESEWTQERRTKDDWKWGVAAKKSFQGFGVVAQAGTDHTKLINESGIAYFDMLSRPAHWYVQVRFFGGVY